MSKSEFKYNKKRKHYSYSHKKCGVKEEKHPYFFKTICKKEQKGKGKDNSKKYSSASSSKSKKRRSILCYSKNYLDDSESFDSIQYNWCWDRNDKRKIKRIKKLKNKK